MIGLNLSVLFAFFCFCSAVLGSLFPFGYLHLVTSMVVTLLVGYRLGLLKGGSSRLRGTIELRTFLLALLGLADLVWILSKQGWGDGTAPYFRPPLHHDLERHLILINAILRKSGSPFFPNAPIAYQTLWHHGIATIIGPWTKMLSYAEFRYALLMTGFLFFWSCLSAIAKLRPSLIMRGIPMGILALVLFTHSDILNLILSYWYQPHPGIEADWSFTGPLIFRMNSLKLVALTAPQNALFAIILFSYIQPRKTWELELATATLLFLGSPPLAMLFLLPYHICRIIQFRKTPWHLLLSLVTVPLAFHLAYGLSPIDTFARPAIFSLEWFPSWWGHWIGLPFLLTGILGMPGFILSLLLGRRLLRVDLLYFWVALILVPFLGYNVLTDIELRRHISILCSLLFVLLISRHWNILRHQFQRRFSSLSLGLALSTWVLLHGYFIYCYVGKPSVLTEAVNWKAYLQVRDLIAEKYSGLPILSAIDPKDWGLSFSPILEATTSFGSPLDASVHSLLTEKQARQLTSIAMGKNIASVATQVGYQAIIWGPVEEKLWGKAIKAELEKNWHPMYQNSSVSLYRLGNDFENSKSRLSQLTAEP